MDVRSRHDVGNLNLSFPYGKVPSVFAREIRQHYFAATSYVDDLIGELLEAAATYGGDDLIVSLHSDHGWSLGQHQEWAKYSNYRSRSISLWNLKKVCACKVAFTAIFFFLNRAATQVPWMISAPKLTRGLKGFKRTRVLDSLNEVILHSSGHRKQDSPWKIRSNPSPYLT